MTSDEELIEAIEREEAKPRKPKTAPAVEKPPVIDGDPERTVRVRCVVESQPWANEMPLHYWKEYDISYKYAVVLEQRRSVVIISTTKGK